MKIDSFEIKHNQYLCVVFSGTKNFNIYNLKVYKCAISISEKRDKISLFSMPDGSYCEMLEADFDLSPIVDAFMLANLEK